MRAGGLPVVRWSPAAEPRRAFAEGDAPSTRPRFGPSGQAPARICSPRATTAIALAVERDSLFLRWIEEASAAHIITSNNNNNNTAATNNNNNNNNKNNSGNTKLASAGAGGVQSRARVGQWPAPSHAVAAETCWRHRGAEDGETMPLLLHQPQRHLDEQPLDFSVKYRAPSELRNGDRRNNNSKCFATAVAAATYGDFSSGSSSASASEDEGLAGSSPSHGGPISSEGKLWLDTNDAAWPSSAAPAAGAAAAVVAADTQPSVNAQAVTDAVTPVTSPTLQHQQQTSESDSVTIHSRQPSPSRHQPTSCGSATGSVVESRNGASGPRDSSGSAASAGSVCSAASAGSATSARGASASGACGISVVSIAALHAHLSSARGDLSSSGAATDALDDKLSTPSPRQSDPTISAADVLSSDEEGDDDSEDSNPREGALNLEDQTICPVFHLLTSGGEGF